MSYDFFLNETIYERDRIPNIILRLTHSILKHRHASIQYGMHE